MKKIMFNNTYGLTQAVKQGTKIMTRRVLDLSEDDEEYLDQAFDWDLRESVILDRYAQYQVGEIVAVAEPYKDIIGDRVFFVSYETGVSVHRSIMEREKGWSNKLYVASEFMPSRIRFTERRIERLQNISQEDCLKEGIAIKKGFWNTYSFAGSNKPRKMNRDGSVVLTETFFNPREAFARLIDKVSKKGTWKRNPWVIAYTFELVKETAQ